MILKAMAPLSKLKIGQTGRIAGFRGPDSLAFYFTEMGLGEGEDALALGRLPFGGNLIILLKNGKYTIRKRDADSIMVEV